ncbi:aminoglycoside phosphotransferase family protein [Klenkia taihuensis]|uniref:Predicted kinase, aminoglycoside phosphotransferase (APT) family n=1 Tax=Klenkia taihuensis TaxID=1225127 RepID=A0A1I1GTC5_9ACTN|nr:aminoglycoside phosphotransferase family protein [Klenkia taihuensis]GHE09556.1 aminoglycoside phosphotransferase [Klenkia taihuensis]SFC14761.1 Predicted kinase, aminoglycoside phosphotransferase (APT) family [Klenkia taihuensis]
MDQAMVRALVAEQFPQWADRSVTPVEPQGNDNRTFRLGDDLAVRLPAAPGYADAVAKEARALPLLARHLAVAVPEVVAVGRPGAGYPHPWSVRRWLPGVVLDAVAGADGEQLGADLGRTLRELHAVPAEDGPAAGAHSCGRGLHPGTYDAEVRAALPALDHDLRRRCAAIWDDALTTSWDRDPVWFHGDLAPGNLLLVDGRLSAVIDLGTCGTGDPACDLVIAWTGLDDAGRAAFRDAVALDDGCWARARGWALWKALVTGPASPLHAQQQRALARLLAGLSEAPGTMTAWTPPR